MPDSPAPKAPYRTPWEPARGVVHPGAYASPAALRRELLDLRQRVDTGQLGDLSAEDLAQTIRELAEARDSLRDFARPTRGVLVTVAATFTGSGLFLAFLKMPTYAWLALGVAIATAVVAALASEWAQRWLDAVPEYEGLIADLRRQASTAFGKAVSSPGESVITVGRAAAGAHELSEAEKRAVTTSIVAALITYRSAVFEALGVRVRLHVEPDGAVRARRLHDGFSPSLEPGLLASSALVDALFALILPAVRATGIRVAPEAGGGDTPAYEAEGSPEAKDDEKKRGER